MPDIAIFEHVRYDTHTQRLAGWGDTDLEEIRQVIERQGVVVLRGVFAADLCRHIRRQVFGYFQSNPPSNPPVETGTPNYWRLDDNPEKAAVKRVNQFYSSFYWNQDLAGEKALMQALSSFKHRVAGLPDTFTFAGVEDGYVTYPTITHFPRGGGRLNRHTDPKNIQFCTILASMSTRGEDYSHGGLYVEAAGKTDDIDGLLNMGDVYLMNPQAVHGVDAIDPDIAVPQWHDERGRWTLFPSLVEVKTTQGVKVAGLEELKDTRR